ncbi:MAG: hypothetical protein ACR2LR_14635 [Hassallia sp.]
MKDYKFDVSSIDKTLDNLNSIEKNLSGLSDMHWELGANKSTKGSQKEATPKNEQNNCVKDFFVTVNEYMDNTIVAPGIKQKINQNEGNISDDKKPAIARKKVSINALAGKENKSVHEAIEIIALKSKREQEAPSFLLKLVKLFMALLLLGTITSYALRDTVCQNNTSDFCQGVSKTTNSIDQN